mgnify:FL=1
MHTYLRYKQRQAVQVLRQLYGVSEKEGISVRGPYTSVQCAAKEIKKTEEFIRKNIAGRKAQMARGRQKQLDRMDKLEALEQKEIKPEFCFQCLPLTKCLHLSVKRFVCGV